MTISVFVEGVPVPQPRVKATTIGGYTRVYTPSKANGWKKIIALKMKRYCLGGPLTGPLAVSLTCYLPRPKTHLKANGELRAKAPTFPTSPRFDVDNLGKAILDALTDVGMWKDDGQVCSCLVRKEYATAATGARIEIKPLVENAF